MKNFIFLLLGHLITINSFAFDGFICNPSDRQTRVQFLEINDQIEIRVTNPAGYEFMPQFDGPVSKFSMGYQKFQYDSLEALGDIFTITWPKKSCALDSKKFNIKCGGDGQLSVKNIQANGIETIKVTEEYYFGTYESRKFRFSFNKEGSYLFSTLQFNIDNCKAF